VVALRCDVLDLREKDTTLFCAGCRANFEPQGRPLTRWPKPLHPLPTKRIDVLMSAGAAERLLDKWSGVRRPKALNERTCGKAVNALPPIGPQESTMRRQPSILVHVHPEPFGIEVGASQPHPLSPAPDEQPS
jgi:hypothetical protein